MVNGTIGNSTGQYERNIQREELDLALIVYVSYHTMLKVVSRRKHRGLLPKFFFFLNSHAEYYLFIA